MFENRLFFVDKLVSMGARIVRADPSTGGASAGPSQLYGSAWRARTILAGMAMSHSRASSSEGDQQRSGTGRVRSNRATSAFDDGLQALAPTSIGS